MTDLRQRGDALARLNELLAGRRGLMTVRGFPGSGKSALLRAFTLQAEAAGFLALGAVGSRAESVLPMGVLSQLTHHPAGPDHQRLARLRALVDEAMATTWSTPVYASPAQARALHRMWLELARLAESTPVLIVVDDAHNADPASLQCLLYFARRLKGACVSIVLAELERPHPVVEPIDLELLSHAQGPPVELAPLDRTGTALLLKEELDGQGDLDTCWELSGGNPALVRAFAADVRAGGQGMAAYARAVLACLHRGRPTGLWAARGLAVLDLEGPAHLHRLLGIDQASADQAARELDRIGVLREGRFRHEEARSAVLSDMDRQERAAMHRRAAKLLHDHGGSRAAIARHLVAALHAPDPWVVPLLQEAATQALLDDEAEFAVDCLNLAVRASDDDRQRMETTLMLARAGWRVNPATVSRHLTMLTLALQEGNLPGHEAPGVVRALLWQGRLHEAGLALTTLGDAGEDGKAGLRATREWLAGVCPPLLARLPGEPAAPRPPQDDVVAEVEGVLRGPGLDDSTMPAVEAALLALMCSDRTQKAAEWCDQAIEEAARRRATTWTALFTALRGEIALRQGDLPLAERRAGSALTLLPPRSWGVAVGLPLATLVQAVTAMGGYEQAVRHLRQPIPEAIFETRFGLHYLEARGHYHLATDRPHSALDDFLSCGELVTKWGTDLPVFPRWRLGAAEACLRMGQLDRCRKLLDEQLDEPAAASDRVRGTALRLRAPLREPPERASLLKEALVLLEGCGDRFALAQVLADLSLAHQALGEWARARAMRQRALDVAAECRAEPLRRALALRQVNQEAHVTSYTVASAYGSPLLSDAEQPVAALAAEGYRNKEIAEMLGVTVSTVEQHLTRIYRKLHVGGRAALSKRLRPPIAGA
ncbi:AAA family ATPase [Nonomuraea sp. SYSU D8015]|uniref:AAA family ATPase n=1 Tax=Nonomuraea sp. SYSU D8015 TaxID=2593644 RepID=UPI001660E734|nr:LuxR family transcriptional regulator [Nonomuraea sp. SYSU D8015]